jgi:hypothetical protein
MFASLVEAVVEDDDLLEVGARVDFPVAVLAHLIRRKLYLGDKHCYIVIARLAALHGNSKRDILGPAGVFSSVQHFSSELAWHCYCQDRVGGL